MPVVSRVEPYEWFDCVHHKFVYSYGIRNSLTAIMLKDHNHDLIHALSEKNDALWRYRNHYLASAAGCEGCVKLWKQFEADDEEHVKLLTEEIKRHMDEGRFD